MKALVNTLSIFQMVIVAAGIRLMNSGILSSIALSVYMG